MPNYVDFWTQRQTDYSDEIAFCEANMNSEIRRPTIDPRGNPTGEYHEGVLLEYRIYELSDDIEVGTTYHRFELNVDGIGWVDYNNLTSWERSIPTFTTTLDDADIFKVSITDSGAFQVVFTDDTEVIVRDDGFDNLENNLENIIGAAIKSRMKGFDRTNKHYFICDYPKRVERHSNNVWIVTMLAVYETTQLIVDSINDGVIPRDCASCNEPVALLSYVVVNKGADNEYHKVAIVTNQHTHTQVFTENGVSDIQAMSYWNKVRNEFQPNYFHQSEVS